MPSFECLPFQYPAEDEIISLAGQFLECAAKPSYSIDDAKSDAFVFLNLRNALDSGFIEGPITHIGPEGRIEFTMDPGRGDNS